MKISLNSYFDPWSKQHYGLKNFKVIPQSRRVAAVILTMLAGLFSFGILALPVFRLLTQSSVPTQTLATKVGKIWDKTIPSPKKIDKNSSGRTPLHYAIFDKDLTSIKSLVEKGADINKKDYKGYSALNYAMMDKNIEAFKFFIENGGNVNNKNHLGLSLLALAIAQNQLEFVKILLENNATLEDCDSKGASALHLACMNGNVEIVGVLLEAGASPLLSNKAGMSPLALARIKRVENYEEIENLFLKKSPLSLFYEREFIHRHLIGHAFSLSHTTQFFPKDGSSIQKGDVESSVPIPLFWEEMEKSLTKIVKERSDLFHKKNQKIVLEALEFAKNPHSSSELFQHWKENKAIFIETGYQNHFVAAVLYNEHLILINRGGGNEGKRVRVEKIQKERITEETIRSIQNLIKKQAFDYVQFMHHEFPRSYCFKQSAVEKGFETTTNKYIDSQIVNNCAWANREGAVLALSLMVENNENLMPCLPLLQKCYLAENYMETFHHQEHAYYLSPLLLAEMAAHLRKEGEKANPQTKERVKKSLRDIEATFAALQEVSLETMAPQVKREWGEEMKKAREILYPYVSLLKTKR